jgi:hypothetical protein
VTPGTVSWDKTVQPKTKALQFSAEGTFQTAPDWDVEEIIVEYVPVAGGEIKEVKVPDANINVANKTFTLPFTPADAGMYEFRVRMLVVKKNFLGVPIASHLTGSETSTKAVPAK